MTRFLSYTLGTLASLAVISFSSAASTGATSKTLTAFQAKEVASKSVPAESRNKLIQLAGDRSDTEITPDVWRFVFFDSTAKQNGRLITVTHGAVNEIRDGYFELEKFRLFAYKEDEIIDPRVLKIDSDKALDVVIKTSQMKDIHLSSVIYSLKKDSQTGHAAWKIQILADDGGQERDLGYAKVSAENGGVMEMKINLGKLKAKTN